MNILTIKPALGPDGMPNMCQGTKVYDSQGHEIQDITKITLYADLDHDLWRAQIECFVTPPEQIIAVGEAGGGGYG